MNIVFIVLTEMSAQTRGKSKKNKNHESSSESGDEYQQVVPVSKGSGVLVETTLVPVVGVTD